MLTFARKPKPTQQTKSGSFTNLGRPLHGHSREVSYVLHLQRTIGNQAVQRLLRTNAEERKDGTHSDASPRFAADFSRIPLYPKASTKIRPKPTDGTPGDVSEQEANRVDKVTGMTESKLSQESVCPLGGRRLMAHEPAPIVQQGKSGRIIMRAINCNPFGGRRPSLEESRLLMRDFPRLRPRDFCITAGRDPSYNCYAFSVGITDQFIDEHMIDFNYGNRDGTFTFGDINGFYNAYGLVPTGVDGDVVVFGSRTPQHAAKKTPIMSGGTPLFESKLGGEERIVHFIDQLEGGLYGNMQRRYARVALRIRRPSHTMIPYELERGQP